MSKTDYYKRWDGYLFIPKALRKYMKDKLVDGSYVKIDPIRMVTNSSIKK